MNEFSTRLGVALLVAGIGGPAFAVTLDGGFKTLDGNAPLVIGHRGAPAYLPENTIGGNELAADLGSDFIETDVMPTSDNVLIAMHDASLERTTNVEEIFEPRNGGYAVADFTYDEISTLTIDQQPPFPGAYGDFTPMADNAFRVPTFSDMLQALNDYNTANGKSVGMLTEGKYADNSTEVSRAVIRTLIDNGFDTPEESAVQSFGFGNVSDYADILAEEGVDMGVAQLGGSALVDDEWFVTDFRDFGLSLSDLAGYTDTVAIFQGQISDAFIGSAHEEMLSVFGWTFRPETPEDALAQTEAFLQSGLDGFITDNPDLVGQVIASAQVQPVPLPASFAALLLGLGGLAGFARRRGARG
ncbi:glycerophosphodiester phosphodiesterase family protein [Roseovarius sp. D22-M7]|uniref:glycerophosphodiester phosphodiesterase family protein n=1 Tax=Roseovarius sp. D22-M7 TaxID=3127116 RepID=UPI0030103B65